MCEAAFLTFFFIYSELCQRWLAQQYGAFQQRFPSLGCILLRDILSYCSWRVSFMPEASFASSDHVIS